MSNQSRSSVDEIKDRIKVWDVARRWYNQDIPDRCGVYRSPWREDSKPSFSIFNEGRAWKDHAAGDGGDVFDLLTRDGKSFGQAISILGSWCNITEVRSIRRSEKQPKKIEPPKTPDEYDELLASVCFDSSSWRDSKTTLKQLAIRKRWPDHMVESLMGSGCLGMIDSRIAWVFGRGIKVRSSAFVSRSDRWLCGKSATCLYLDKIFNPRHQTVFLCEGETDCVSLLFSGIRKKCRASILGVAGASVKPHPEMLKPMIYGKTVVIIGDNDKAGRGFIGRMTKHISLQGVLPKYLNWGDLPYNDVSDFFASEGPSPVVDWISNSNHWDTWQN